MNNVTRLSEIQASPIQRFNLGFPDLNRMYGTSELPEHNIGAPLGKISLWSGESGTGKSRLAIAVAKLFCQTYFLDGRVLYIQTESTLSDFASWANDTSQYNRIFCSGEDNIDNIINIIYSIRPHLIIIDSVNELDGFENGTKQEAKRLINGLDGKPGLKQVVNELNSHLILLCQLNQDGKTIKGGSSLPHLVDVHVNLVKTIFSSVFECQIGIKNRFGSKDNIARFQHTDNGVIPYNLNNTLETKEVKPQEKRVKAMTRSGTCKVDENGHPDYNDPEFQEHLANMRKSQYGELGLWSKLNMFAGKIMGK